MTEIEANYQEIRRSIPDPVIIVAAAKSRTAEEVTAAIRAGITVVGHNYVQEAEEMIKVLGAQATWHMLGHVQRNKVKKVVHLFDMVETLDSWPLAGLMDRHCADLGKIMPVLVEVNSGREEGKTGVLPEDLEDLVQRLAGLSHLRVQGLMTMGPQFDNPEEIRPYFRATKAAFDRLAAAGLPNTEMRYLSMGMSNSYQVAIEEGSNMVRIGTRLFGPRTM